MATPLCLSSVYSTRGRKDEFATILESNGISGCLNLQSKGTVVVSSYLAGTERFDGELSDINPLTFG